jgi:large subunit ribosomal protein L22
MKAFLKNYHESPRKVRLVAGLVKGKPVATALSELSFLSKKASLPIKKLINSAIANAKNNFKINADNLFIKGITINKGNVLKRSQPMSRGRAFPIKKRLSHIEVTLEEKKDASKKVKQITKKW